MTNNNQDEQQQFIRGMLQMAVLTELEYGRKYGAQLLVALSKTPFSSKVGTLYPLLNRMEKGGLLSCNWHMASGQTPRKYYQLTAAGQKKLHEDREFLQQIQTYLGGK